MQDYKALIESAVQGSVRDARALLLMFGSQMDYINQSQGLNWLDPTSGTQKAASQPPAAASASATGANGLLTVQITNPSSVGNQTIWHEVSYSPVKNFSQSVTTLPATPATGAVIPAPGQTLYIRLRSSFDRVNWNSYSLVSTDAAAAGLQSSAATESNVVLNQTNYATVDSVALSGAAAVRIYGTAGPNNGYTRQKGSTQVTRPSGTIVNVGFGTTQLVAWDGEKFRLTPTLGGMFDDSWEPVGQCSVVDSGAPTLPAVSLVLSSSGGHVIGWNVTNQGNGLTADVTLTINTSTGSGATPGAQTIQNGKLISVAPGNPGQSYAGTDTVTVSGGVGSGAAGGGTASGGNGGRLTAV